MTLELTNPYVGYFLWNGEADEVHLVVRDHFGLLPPSASGILSVVGRLLALRIKIKQKVKRKVKNRRKY